MTCRHTDQRRADRAYATIYAIDTELVRSQSDKRTKSLVGFVNSKDILLVVPLPQDPCGAHGSCRMNERYFGESRQENGMDDKAIDGCDQQQQRSYNRQHVSNHRALSIGVPGIRPVTRLVEHSVTRTLGLSATWYGQATNCRNRDSTYIDVLISKLVTCVEAVKYRYAATACYMLLSL